MARVRGGLFSIEASGQFAQSLVFDKRGYVREYKVPSNPNQLLDLVAAQADQRFGLVGADPIFDREARNFEDCRQLRFQGGDAL